MKLKKPELLVGAGDFSSVIAASNAGADAIYFGVKGYNMRDLGTNFKPSELRKLMSFLHDKKMKGYLALNTIIFEEELSRVEKILATAKKAGVDAVILSDLGVLSLARKHKLNIFLSTQASVTNSIALKEYKSLGVKRVIFAREMNLTQIKEVTKKAHKLGIEAECFVHGAMCISVSGRCFLSHELFGRSANRGECLQPCRRAFFLDGAKPDYEKKEVYLQGDTILSAKDLKSIDFLDKIINSGIDSIKIEGRTKPADYVFATTKCYREGIDSVFDKTFSKEKISEWNNELSKVYNRGFSNGFFFDKPSGKDLAKGQGSFQTQKRVQVGIVTKYYVKVGVAEIKLFDSLSVGDTITIEGVTTFIQQKVDSMEINNKVVFSASKDNAIGVKVSERVRPNDKVFKFVKRINN
ncbi:MAG: U32 family peptidase [Candidatus ainarchaeum sp.]|nr:U32 family peptidase [Candidatus ainarchaeum sp.]MDD4467790.1 U32 family peptidase [Candidatus ainarchaeum sp.]